MSSNTMTASYRRSTDKVNSIVLYGVCGLLMFGPLAFGAVEPWSIFILEAGSASLLLFWIGTQVWQGKVNIRWNPLFLPMGVFGLLVLSQLAFHLTAYSHDTVSLFLRYIAYAILCFLACQTLSRTVDARRLAFIFSVYGAVLAAFALIQGISANGKLYWLRQPRLGGWIYGPYVNHNHYAGLMEMLVPIPLVLALTRLASTRTRNIAAGAAAVMVGTVFLSGSRGGMLAIAAELAILAALLLKQKRGLRTAIGLCVFLAILVSL